MSPGRRLLFALPLLLAGCVSGDPAGPRGRGPATPEQLRAAYPDLASGRFTVLADFNTPEQLAALQPEAFKIGHGRGATGGGAAVARVAAGQEIRLTPAVSDWHEQTLLLLSVRSAVAQQFEVAARGSSGTWRRSVALEAGWNLLRFDVAEIGMRVDLAGVEALELRPAAAAELALDDILLVDDRQRIESESAAVRLVTETRGLRVQSGVPGSFGLVLQGGVLADWRGGSEVASGGGTGVGPWLLPVSPGWETQPPAAPRAATAFVGTQRVVEADFRTVVEAETPSGTRRWVIYPHGLAVHAWSAGTLPEGRRAAELLSVAGTANFEMLPGPPSTPGEVTTRFCLLMQEGEEPDLLWCPAESGEGRKLISRFAPGGGDLLVAMGDRERVASASAFFVAASELDERAALGLARGYQHPPRPEVTTGQLVRGRAGDLDGDGFNESEGCYELAARDRRLRVRLDPEGAPLETPVFRVTGTRDLRCWVYANGRIVTDLGRDAEGALLFSVPGRHERALTIEVTAVPVGAGGSG